MMEKHETAQSPAGDCGVHRDVTHAENSNWKVKEEDKGEVFEKVFLVIDDATCQGHDQDGKPHEDT